MELAGGCRASVERLGIFFFSPGIVDFVVFVVVHVSWSSVSFVMSPKSVSIDLSLVFVAFNCLLGRGWPQFLSFC